jgi:hypothetical protein
MSDPTYYAMVIVAEANSPGHALEILTSDDEEGMPVIAFIGTPVLVEPDEHGFKHLDQWETYE